ncbi:helix-turn-helix domain-containing protein [Bifidobacterium pseudolongum]|uniref:helix-turn-helix domain-containing protein n=1 Tax=Bifidobacterium pseudolongum TaxID=1694 RepID=UPI0010209122|nr:helix-turn-helix domain-containing protein [Bifidobacterium pseudolongum]
MRHDELKVRHFPDVLQAEMNRRGTSLRDLEGQTGIPKSTIGRKLSFGNFSLEEADRLSMALGVKLSTLIRRAEALASKEGEKR